MVSDSREDDLSCKSCAPIGRKKMERMQKCRNRFSLKNFKYVDVQAIINSSNIATSVGAKTSPDCKVSSLSAPRENETADSGEKTCVSDLCEVTLKKSKVLTNNKKRCVVNQQNSCDESGASFPGPSNFGKHKVSRLGVKPCPDEKNFVSGRLRNVRKTRHSSGKPYMCNECGISFLNLSSLKEHKGAIHLEKPFSCEICNKMFVNVTRLNIHMRSHSGEKPFACNICDATFPYPQTLRVHRFIHLGKPYVCDMCGRTFVSNSKLRVHLRTHTGEKPFVCSVCSAKFGRKDNLSTHLLTHSGGQRSECDLCGRTFATNESLRCHKRSHCKATHC